MCIQRVTKRTRFLASPPPGAASYLLNPFYRLSHFSRDRRSNSSGWKGCRSMNSYDRSPRVTDQPTGREGKGEEATVQMPTPPRPPYMSLAPTTVADAAVEATATALDMVGAFSNQMWKKKKKSVIAAGYCVKKKQNKNTSTLFQARTLSSPMLLRLTQSAEMSSATGPLLERTRTGELCGKATDLHRTGL